MAASALGEASDAPRDVIRAAGDWLATQLAAEGFAWLPSKRLLRREVDGLIQEITLQPDRYNRRGSWISAQGAIGVREPALGRWRTANASRVSSGGDYICGTALGYASGRANGFRYGDYTDGELNLTDPSQRLPKLHTWLAKVRTGVIPYLDEASHPEAIVFSRAVEICGNPAGIVEWLIFRQRPQLIPPLVEYFMDNNPGWADGVEHGRALGASGGSIPLGCSDMALRLGWVCQLHQP
ncbi:hypothetical protein Cme02nite_51420 [Catellatospora methionotrophica]|uniref:Uncharacterized protein n=1 Tax=Catellatospora methionotrophica TaxID=121620 RepID=A0A8J3LLJ4_9ACTN|nr:hypothetical protein [Catellatospora methionotrophica]GIG16810.1 hypothetical protein Cme02nite_51420 [Catellatospora methionotrophica]